MATRHAAAHHSHVAGEVHEPVAVAPLVVVPGYQLDEGVVQGDAGGPVEDRGELAGVEVRGDDVVLGVGQDALHGPRGSLLDLR
eukprot:CAMPEP_0113826838 /NCGR_PEP_ID=MMETSP0328-20130328/4462_1 /TAXON_ID=39455 /ORGANISM="Alexandrium minutum" /LENGTH=83 /DNA_ID=CAMNT_0000794817 /DNA_START=370 /DNA_END=617 /DNA_ORIENTATION=- /assembly_acc=CAM_ASM_000350